MLRFLSLNVAVLAVIAATAACNMGGGMLRDHIDADPVEVRASEDMRALEFRVSAHVSAAVTAGEVNVLVRGAGYDSDGGQVRVTVVRGALRDDPAPSADVVDCHGDGAVTLAHDALQECAGDCTQDFTALFAAEGLPTGGSVALPVSLEAELVYESVAEAPADDFLRLSLR